CLDRECEGRSVSRHIALRWHHRGQVQSVCDHMIDGRADESACLAGQCIDRLGRRTRRREHQIPLVFAVRIVHEDDHSPRGNRRRRRGDRYPTHSCTPPVVKPTRSSHSCVTSAFWVCVNRSTYLASTSTSRLTAAPTGNAASVLCFCVWRTSETVNPRPS